MEENIVDVDGQPGGPAGSLEQRKGKQRGLWTPIIVKEGGAPRSMRGSWTPAIGVNRRRRHASPVVGLKLGDAGIRRGGTRRRWDLGELSGCGEISIWWIRVSTAQTRYLNPVSFGLGVELHKE
jgi:hypothetical protein